MSVEDATPATTTFVRDEVVPAKGWTSFTMKKGQSVRIEDIEGQQAVDFLCFNMDDQRESFLAAHTAKLKGSIYVSTGDVLYSNLARPMMTITEDTVGVNDLICGSCSFALDALRYGEEKATPGCVDLFVESVQKWGIERHELPMCFNIFLRYPVNADGTVSIDHEAPSKAGDSITLRAEMDLKIAITACPQINNPCTGFNPTPIRVQVS